MEKQQYKEIKMLKNYVVKIKNVIVGKQNNIIDYLSNENHKNHTGTTFKKVSEIDEEEAKENLLSKLHQNQLNYLKSKTNGRRIKRIAKSLTFNIPKSYKPSAEEVISINLKLLEAIENLFQSMSIDLTKNDLYSIIHFEEEKHDHVNLILPMLGNDGKNIRHFNSPLFIRQLKAMFTEIVDNTLNRDIKQYKALTPEQQEHNAKLRDIERLKADYQALLQTINEAEQPRAVKFINNELVKIERTLKNSEQETINDYISQLNKSVDKVNKSGIKGTINRL